jgi:hypothetical protein
MITISSDVVYYGISKLLWVAISSHLSMEEDEHIIIYFIGGMFLAGFNLIVINFSNHPLIGTLGYVYLSLFSWIVGLFINLYRFHKNY